MKPLDARQRLLDERTRARKEAARKLAEDEKWRLRLLTPDEQEEYRGVRSMAWNPPKSLARRKNWPFIVLTIPIFSGMVGVGYLQAVVAPANPSVDSDSVFLLFLIPLGALVGALVLHVRRAGRLSAEYQVECDKAIAQFYARIGYTLRRWEAEREEADFKKYMRDRPDDGATYRHDSRRNGWTSNRRW